MNLLIGDNYFKQNPTKILGNQVIKKGRFGSDMIVVEGNLSNLDSIDAVPVQVQDLHPTQVLTDTPIQKVIDQVFETDAQESKDKKVAKLRNKPARKTSPISNTSNQEVYSFAEIDALYNKQITRDQKEAYYFTHPELNHKLLFDKFKNSKDDLVEKKLICWDAEEKKFVYVYSYTSGNIGKKISWMQREKTSFIERFGNPQYDLQMQLLSAARPKQKGLVGDDRILILPHSNFAKQFVIKELRYQELNAETSLFYAFRYWLIKLPPDNYKKTTSREIIDFYLDNKNLGANKSDNKEQQEKDERNAINIRQRTKEEGDELFSKFLAEELVPEDQAKLQFLWNEKFNSYAEPDLTKIPVCFQISKTFKKGPLFLNPTQRQAAAFQTEKSSALFAYGVGVGKTLASIVSFSQSYYNGYAKRGVFVVPTNTYDKWLGEIQGYTDKDTGEFMAGALPQLPPIVGVYNLNPVIVREKLKEYSRQDEKQFDDITQAITYLKKIEKEEPTMVQQKAISNLYPVNWNGLNASYLAYQGETKSARPKTFTQFAADFLKEEYNYLIYALGKVKQFPAGTIFVTTEVGLQRLGVGEQHKDEMKAILFRILSQGESSSDKEDKRDVATLLLRIEQTISSSMKNAKLLIEDLGIDWACFDEAHYYKKLFTFVKGQIIGEKATDESGGFSVKREKSKYELRSGSYPSSRALSAFVLSTFIQNQNQNRNVIQLTATPFTNSPLEVYSMLVLTNFKALQDMGMGNMIDFFDTFMRINYDIKYTPQKTVVKDVVLTGYNNLPQLRQLIYSLMDKKDEGASLKRPVKIIYPSIEKGIETTLPMTFEQTELMAEVKKYIQGDTEYEDVCAVALQEEIETLDFDSLDDEALIGEWERSTAREFEGDREGLSDSRRDALIRQIKGMKIQGLELGEGQLDEEESAGVRILKGLAMMRQITLSPFLYHKACRKASGEAPVMPDYKEYVLTSPKFKYAFGCLKSVLDWHKGNRTKASGTVFYMNAGVEYFPLLKQYAVKELGLKESQVGIVSGSMSKSAKETMKQRFLSGDILLLIGSSTISVGVDLQNNATSLFNLYYDWNPTDAAQIEGRIWHQGNRFAFVRINYPQCFNSADPVIFEYLNQKTLRINEIWNRSSEVQELDLRDFNPKELQKKLITDPEEKADWDVLEETDKIQGEIIFAENRRETLSNAMYSFRKVNELRPSVISWLNRISDRKLTIARDESIANQKEKINEIVTKYESDPNKMADEISKYKKSRYDHENDPDGKYKVTDYETIGDEKIFADAKKYGELVSDWDYKDSSWGDLYYERDAIRSQLQEFRTNYRDMKASEERVLKPMGLSFENATNPMADFDRKIVELKTRLDEIEATRPERVERYRQEAAANQRFVKTVDDRIREFAAANDEYLGPQLMLTFAQPIEPIVEPTPAPVAIPAKKEKAPDAPVKIPVKKKTEPAKEKIPAPASKKVEIEKQIKALSIAVKFAPDKAIVEKQIKALEIALKFAA